MQDPQPPPVGKSLPIRGLSISMWYITLLHDVMHALTSKVIKSKHDAYSGCSS